MKTLERYRLVCKILVSVAVASQGLYYSVTQPGPMDIANGLILGLVIYTAFFNRDPEIKQ